MVLLGFGARPASRPGRQPGDALQCRRPWQRVAACGAAVSAPGPLVLRLDPGGRFRVLAVPAGGLPVPGGIVGGAGDLQQLAHAR